MARELLAIFESESQIRDFQPNFERIASLDAFAVTVSAPGDAVDYVYRFFAPRQVFSRPSNLLAKCILVPSGWASRQCELGAHPLSARRGTFPGARGGSRAAR